MLKMGRTTVRPTQGLRVVFLYGARAAQPALKKFHVFVLYNLAAPNSWGVRLAKDKRND
jgi:hypothetical protein